MSGWGWDVSTGHLTPEILSFYPFTDLLRLWDLFGIWGLKLMPCSWGPGPNSPASVEEQQHAVNGSPGFWHSVKESHAALPSARGPGPASPSCGARGRALGKLAASPQVRVVREGQRLVTHSGTSCGTSGAGDLFCCNPVRFDLRFGSAEPGAASSSDWAGEPSFSEVSTVSGETGFPEEPGSWLEGFSPFPGACLLRGLWSLPLPRDIRLRRPTESSSLAASFSASDFGRAGGVGVAVFSPFLPRAGCSGDLTPLPAGSLALPGSSPGSTLLTTFLTAFATLFRDRPWASSLGPSAEAVLGPFMASVDAGFLALWGASEGTGLVEG